MSSTGLGVAVCAVRAQSFQESASRYVYPTGETPCFTEQQRLRFDKRRPPYHPDGSLAYAEMGDRLKEADQARHTVSPAKTSLRTLPADWGTFAELLGRLAADPASRADMCSSEQNLLAVLRSSISSKQIPHLMPVSSPWSSTDLSVPQNDPDIWTVANI
ncbi:hypothetical protein F5141DRAFT_80151 [Pisolithus sp. B1]|nr:hypothetical protein F5141DRAFT_80151 [Pisolithus sp. B1]